MVEPMAAMYAAIEAVSEEKVAEIELEFEEDGLDGSERRLTITVRNEVRHLRNITDDEE